MKLDFLVFQLIAMYVSVIYIFLNSSVLSLHSFDKIITVDSLNILQPLPILCKVCFAQNTYLAIYYAGS